MLTRQALIGYMMSMLIALTPVDIRKGLMDVNRSQADIARTAGVRRQTVNDVIWRRRTIPRVRRLIASSLGMTYLRVWGEADPADAGSSLRTGSPGTPDTSSSAPAPGAA